MLKFAIASKTLDLLLTGLSAFEELTSFALVLDSDDCCLEHSGRGWLISMLVGRVEAESSCSSSVKIELLLPLFSRYGRCGMRNSGSMSK